jgi:hypothetical protein
MPRRYNTDVLILAADHVDWGMQAMLMPLSTEDRVRELEKLVLRACVIPSTWNSMPDRAKIDKADDFALSLIELLFQACHDVRILPYVSHTNEFGRWLQDEKWRELKDSEVLAKAEIADIAMRIYGEMIDKKKHPTLNWLEHDPRDKHSNDTYHQKTRLRLLREIAREWVETSDEVRSKVFFDLLVQAAQASHSEYKKAVQTVIREFNRQCYTHRLEEHVLSLKPSDPEEFFGILLLGWRVSKELVLLKHVIGNSQAAVWKFVQDTAEKATAFEEEVLPLFKRKEMTTNPPGYTEEGPLSLWKLSMIDPTRRAFIAVQTFTHKWSETEVIRKLYEVRSQVQAWLKAKNVHLNISLVVNRTDYYGTKITFTQTETC